MKKILLAMLFSVFLLSAMAVPAQSQTTVGVSVGDSFTYIGDYFHDADVGGSTIPNQLLPYVFWNATDSITRTVTDVTGTVITWETEYQFSNGSTATETGTEDITNPADYTCIPANLEVGDVFYYDGTYAQADLTITEERTIDYGETSRPANYHFTTTGAWATVGRQYWFDKETGILVKAVLDATYAGAEQNSTSGGSFELIESSVWVVPEFPTGTVMLLVFVAVTVCVEIYRRKRLKRHIG